MWFFEYFILCCFVKFLRCCASVKTIRYYHQERFCEPLFCYKKQTMKLFQSIRNSFALMGINSYQSNQLHPFNKRNVLSILLHFTSVTLTILYLLKVANTFEEYTNAAFSISGVTIAALGAVNVILTMDEWFKVMNNFENIVNKRELKFYIQIISSIDKCSKWCTDFRTNRSGM